ncbi:MAG TPA: L,D-transpeptidase family protein [Thermoanaerobaculia bacterium]|nr:L,D-transpeptidase family protein [Thermoanaerobaculia bacterium]
MRRPPPRRLTAALLALPLTILLLGSAGCTVDEEDEDRAAEPAPAPESAAGPPMRASVPADGYRAVDWEQVDRERLDSAWRTAADADRGSRGAAAGTTSATAGSDAAPVERLRSRAGETSPSGSAGGDPAATGSGGSDSWEDIGPDAFESFQPVLPVPREGGGPTVLALQWMLDRVRFSPGVIDGRWGKNTEKAVYWLQDALGEEPTGEVDRALWDRLVAETGSSPVRRHPVTAQDVEGPFRQIPEEPTEQADLDCLCHESAAEALAERFHTTPELLAQLNPQADLDQLSAGITLTVPAVDEIRQNPSAADRVARIRVSKDGFYLQALDESGNVLYHFPTTVGADYDPSPSGDFRVTGIAFDPDFHYQPELFADVPDSDEDALLPPGPNSPEGLVWMQLSKENYGIHGTSEPATIGYTTSHGCVRLTNWDAVFLANRTARGTPVEFTGGSGGSSGAEASAAASSAAGGAE